ncbi:MAG TPA: glycosyltransferase family 39 protein [Polyangia bacterium]
MKRSTRKQSASPSAPRAAAAVLPPAAPAPRAALAAAATAAVLAFAAIPGGPGAFLPAALAWPLALLAALALWLPLAGPGGGTLPRRAPAALEAAGLTVVLGTYLLLKVVGLHASGTDDNIYFYLAVRTGQGAVPYRDFFFAHPPVHLLVPALVFKLTGFSIGVAKAIPALAQAAAGVCLYLAVRRASRGFALAVLALHLTAYQVLMGSTDMNGENIMTAFLCAAVLAATRGRPALAGVLAGLALGSGLYAFAGVLALAIACAGASRRALGRFAAGAAASFGGLCLVFALLAGRPFLDGVFAYHLAKPGKGGRLPVFASPNPLSVVAALAHNLADYLGSAELKKSLFFHLPQHLAALLAAGLIAGRAIAARLQGRPAAARALLTPRDLLASTPAGLAKLGLLAAVLFLLQWAGLSEVYDFYSVPMLALLALPAGYAVWQGVCLARDATTWAGLRGPALLAGLFALHLPLTDALNAALWPDEARDAGRVVRYDWHDPAALTGLAGVSRALFFTAERTKGERTPPYRHYVWNKMLTFATVGEIAAHVRAHSAPDETLTGASTLAPLVALEAGRRLAGDEADTNNKRFASGLLTDERFFARACRDRLRYIIGAPRSHFTAQMLAQSPTVARYFQREREFADRRLLHHGRAFPITLYRRQDVPGLPPGLVCDAR